MINYSIIIPHKNIPHLLQRCLDSIPRRGDVQIIIVDDNSDTDKVDFANFPGLNDPRIEVIFGKNENGRKGAGYARNLALEKAKGKWLVFADADDFFTPCFDEALDKYKDDENDVIYFYVTSVDSDTLAPGDRHTSRSTYLSMIRETNNWNIAYWIFSPWGKFIKRDLVEKNNILFQEVQHANDVFFSSKATYYSAKKLISDCEIYCITYRSGSLEQVTTIDSKILRFQVFCDTIDFFNPICKNDYLISSAVIIWLTILKHDGKIAFS
jgi:glycosyltransferase involved in cell wall biosynthesis